MTIRPSTDGTNSYRNYYDWLAPKLSSEERKALDVIYEAANRSNGPLLPLKPTMGMWDDFSSICPVKFDTFEKAAQKMLDGLRRDQRDATGGRS